MPAPQTGASTGSITDGSSGVYGAAPVRPNLACVSALATTGRDGNGAPTAFDKKECFITLLKKRT